MTDTLPWFVLPLVALLLLIAIHTYLGLHVITRKVLFVDLALAQIAALGSTVAFLYGFESADTPTFVLSLLFAIAGAWVFSITRTRGERVPQEAIIGLAFAIASAGSIVLSAENPHGAEHLRDVMAGSILVVTPRQIGNAALLYAAIGAIHWVLRDKFLLVSRDPEGAAARGLRVRVWDFLFYVTFAFVITISVNIAGVLLVFCLLIAPAVTGALFADRLRTRLLIGWASSAIAAAGGLLLSDVTDWPPAPSIICVYAALLVASGVFVSVRGSLAPLRRLVTLAVSGLVLLGLGVGVRAALLSPFAHTLGSDAHDEHAHDAGHAPAEAEAEAPDAGGLDALLAQLHDPSTTVRERAAAALVQRRDPASIPALVAALSAANEDEWVRLHEAEALARLGQPAGHAALRALAQEAEAAVVRSRAAALAAELAPPTP